MMMSDWLSPNPPHITIPLSVSKMKRLKVSDELFGILSKINSEAKTIEQ